MSEEQNISVTNFKKFKLAFLGDQGVGKSSIISKYVYDSFEDNINPTIGVDFVVKTIYSGDKTYKIHFWDTAGQERFKSLIPSYIKDCQVAIIVYDITRKETFNNIQGWYQDILNERGEDIILGLLGNKIDLEERQVTTAEGFKMAEKIKAIFQECSAKEGDNLASFFKSIFETLIKNLDEEAEEENNNGGLNIAQSSNKQAPSKGGCCR